MAQLGKVFLNTVYTDSPSRSVNITSRSVESGEPVSDHVKREQSSFNISGIIVGKDSAARMKKLEKYMYDGQVLKYVNRITATGVLIQQFNSNHGAEIKGGYAFDITLQEIKIVKSATIKGMNLPKSVRVKVKATTKKGTQQKQKTTQIKKTTKKTTKAKKTSTAVKTTKAVASKRSGMTPAQAAAANGNHVKK